MTFIQTYIHQSSRAMGEISPAMVASHTAVVGVVCPSSMVVVGVASSSVGATDIQEMVASSRVAVVVCNGDCGIPRSDVC